MDTKLLARCLYERFWKANYRAEIRCPEFDKLPPHTQNSWIAVAEEAVAYTLTDAIKEEAAILVPKHQVKIGDIIQTTLEDWRGGEDRQPYTLSCEVVGTNSDGSFILKPILKRT